jgi:spermidine synthase
MDASIAVLIHYIFRRCLVCGLLIGCTAAPSAFSENSTAAKKSNKSVWQVLADVFTESDPSPVTSNKTLLEQQSKYFDIAVESDANGRRWLLFKPNNGVQGVWDPEQPNQLISPYAKYAAILMQQTPHHPRRALFIGMGAGIVPRYMRRHYPEMMIDIVEIDPDIPQIAEKFFGFENPAGYNIITADGRDFINRNQKKYDMILIDAYGPAGTPFHLTTIEFYQKIRLALSPEGIMVVNLANLADKQQFIASAIKTVAAVFPDLSVFACNGKSNYILAAKAETEITDQALRHKFIRIDGPENPGIKIEEIIAGRMNKDEFYKICIHGQLLKDNFAPVEALLRQ